MVNAQDRREFKMFCRNATDEQLRNIYHKEREAALWDDDREFYQEIAEAELERRGLGVY